MRQEMNDEDEFYSVLEARDTQVMKLNEQLTEKKKQLNEQKAQLNEQKAQLSEKQAQLNEKTVRLAEAEAQLKEQKSQVEAMVKAMVGNGMTIEAVAKMMNKSEDEINDLL